MTTELKMEEEDDDGDDAVMMNGTMAGCYGALCIYFLRLRHFQFSIKISFPQGMKFSVQQIYKFLFEEPSRAQTKSYFYR